MFNSPKYMHIGHAQQNTYAITLHMALHVAQHTYEAADMRGSDALFTNDFGEDLSPG